MATVQIILQKTMHVFSTENVDMLAGQGNKKGNKKGREEKKLTVPSSLPTAHCQNSATGTRTRVARVRAEYPNQLDYSGSCKCQTQTTIRGQTALS